MGVIEKQSIQDIANAIRDRNGLTTLYKPREMDEAILNLYSTTKVNNMLDYILPCYEKEATDFTIKYADSDRPCSISELEGNTTQNGTPTPTTPIPIYTVSGDNEVVVSNENLFDKNTDILENYTFGGSGQLISDNNYFLQKQYISVLPNTTYYFSRQTSNDNLRVCEYKKDFTFIKRDFENYTITTSADTYYIRVSNMKAVIDTLQIKTSTIGNYVSHNGNYYRLDFGGVNNFYIAEGTYNGITITRNSDGTYLLNGTATATSRITNTVAMGNIIGTIAGKISKAITSGTIRLRSRDSSGTLRYDLSMGTNTTPNTWLRSTGTVAVNVNSTEFTIENGTVLDNVILYAGLYKGSYTVQTLPRYTPYVSNPIELCKIGNYQDKLLQSKGNNLCFNIQLQDANNIRYYFDKTISQTFTFSTIVNVATANNSIYLVVDGTNYGRIGTISGTANTIISGTYTLSDENYQAIQNGNECYLLLYKSSAGFTLPNYGMLNKGTTALPYEPYGTEWYIEKNIGKVVLNGSETWTRTAKGSNYVFGALYTTLGIPVGRYEANSKLCNYFPYEFKVWTQSTVNHLAENSSYSLSLLFNVDTSIATTVEEWNSWLSTNNTTVYYVLANPTYEVITNTNLIEQLNNLQDIILQPSLCYVDWVGIEKPKMKLFCYLDKDKIIEEITG